MGEKIDPTWLAFSFDKEPSGDELSAGIARLNAHYGSLVDYPLEAKVATANGLGVLVLGDAEPRCAWPFFCEDDSIAAAYAYVPVGFSRVAGVEAPSARAAMALGRALISDPARTRELTPPFAAAVLDRRAGRLTVVNDWMSAGRCFEAKLPHGTFWTNRAAAAHIFAGVEATADDASWQVLAGSGWFMSSSTPIKGVEALPRGSVLTITPGTIERRETGALESLVDPADSYASLRDRAAEHALDHVRLAASLWPTRPTIDLSGGRDSRVVVAAAVAAGIDGRVVTSDRTIGEAEVATELMARASGRLEHKLRKTSNDEVILDRPLLERALNVHLLHDGMRRPQKVRGNQDLPRERPMSASLSGHGGVIAKGFYYSNAREHRRLGFGGKGKRRKLARRHFSTVPKLIRPECNEATGEALDRALGESAHLGLRGAERLEGFYLLEPFAHRQGLASHAERITLFASPAFVAAAFAMKPRDRMVSRLHEDLIARFAPEWSGARYFAPADKTGPLTRRQKLWESPQDAEAMDEMLSGDGSWTKLYRPDAMRGAWAKLKAGEGNRKWETAFEGAVYREGFDDFLARVNSIVRS